MRFWGSFGGLGTRRDGSGVAGGDCGCQEGDLGVAEPPVVVGDEEAVREMVEPANSWGARGPRDWSVCDKSVSRGSRRTSGCGAGGGN